MGLQHASSIETLADATFELGTWSKDPAHHAMAADPFSFTFDEVMNAARANASRRSAGAGYRAIIDADLAARRAARLAA